MDASESDDDFYDDPFLKKASQPLDNTVAWDKGQSSILDRHLDSIIAKETRSSLQYPWHGMTFDKMLPDPFKSGISDPIIRPALWKHVSAATEKPAQQTLRQQTGMLLSAAVRRLHVVPWPQQKAALRQKSIARWRMIVEENLAVTSLGR